FDVHGIERLAGGHEQAVALFATEAKVGANFWQHDHSDTLAVRRENMNAIIAITHPARGGPDVAVHIRSNAVGAAELTIELHRAEAAPVFQLLAIHDVVNINAARVGASGVGDVQQL